MRKLILSILLAHVSITMMGANASAQNWRQPNPNQANGYHASEASSHYHGKYHEPAQQQNGYHASEARSHYGGSKFEPSSGWDRQSNSGPGSAFRSESSYSGGPGSAFSNASSYSNASRFQNGGPENSYADRMCRSNRWQMGYRHLAAAGYVPGGGSQGTEYGAQQPTGFQSFGSRFQTYAPMVERESAWRQRAIQNVEDGRGGFTRMYAEN